MSKYIKQDDIFELVRTGVLVGNSNFESVSKYVGSLPTIEVSEDCSDFYKGYCARYEDGCFRQCKDAPSVVPKRAEGEWQITINQDYRCSNCNKITSSYKANYCPNCGAKMKG